MNQFTRRIVCVFLAAMMCTALATYGYAQQSGERAGASEPAKEADETAKAAEQPAQPAPGAQDVVDDLLKKRQDPATVEPTRRPVPRDLPPTVAPQVDPRIVGVAPGGEAPKLRREGEFVVSRRGRLVRASDASHMLFVFDSDSRFAPEPPMILMPCQLLESMENLVRERGDAVVFVLTGQVFTYHGANYLLPSIMKITVDQGNLQK